MALVDQKSAQLKKKYYVVRHDHSDHLLEYHFWYLLVLYKIFSAKSLKIAPKWPIFFLFLFHFGGQFYYHSNDKIQINTIILCLGYCSNKPLRSNW